MPFITNESFIELVRGKTVALVGPSASAADILQGPLIDSYDFVARVKSYYVPVEKRKNYGERIDFLYTDNDNTNDVFEGDIVVDNGSKRDIQIGPANIGLRQDILRTKVQTVISTCPRAEWFFERSLARSMTAISSITDVRIMPDSPYMDIRRETNRPNAGFSAIIDLVSLPFSEIYITGIDFYRSLYRQNYRNSLWTKDTIENMVRSPDGTTPDGKPDFHDPDAQFAYFKYKMYNVDDRIKVDHVFQEYLENPLYEKFENCLESK